MQLSEISPFVRYARRVTPVSVADYSMPLTACDHRLFFCMGGEASVFVAGVEYPLRAGRLLFVRAGVEYRYGVMGEGIDLYAFNFDFGMEYSSHETPIPPDAAGRSDTKRVLEEEVPSHPAFTSVTSVFLPEMSETVVRMEQEYRHGRMLYRERLSHLLADLLLAMVRAAVEEETPRAVVTVRRITAYIREHYMEQLSNESVARAFSYHPNYINRLMVAHTGQSLHAYLNRYRMDRAISLLSSTTLPVSEIAARVGIPDLSHFSKNFRRFTGYAPGAFRCKL